MDSDSDPEEDTAWQSAEVDDYNQGSEELKLTTTVTQAPAPRAMKQNANISVFPPVVEFQGIEPGVLYVLTISIQNVSSRVRRIRIKPPKTENFVLNHIPTGNVAAGMDIKAEIEFQMSADSTSAEYYDSITITSEKDVIELPLRAFIPAPNITFDGFLNLGVVVKGNTITKYVDFMNDGFREGTFNIEADESSSLSISPCDGKLSARGRFEDLDGDGRMEADEGEFLMGGAGKYHEKVKMEFVANDLGDFRQLVKVKLDGQPDRVIDVCAVMEQKLELVLNGAVISSVPFGAIHYGEQRSVTAMLVNHGPMCTSFSIGTSHLDDSPESEDPDAPPIAEIEDDDDDMLPKPIVIKPQEGVIQPYSKLPVVVQFNPVYQEETTGYAANPTKQTMELRYGLMAKIESSETQQVIPVAITGTAIKPALQVSQKIFKFGESPVNDRRDILVTIKNGGKLKLPYNINKVANFSCKPSKGVLQPGQSQKVVVSFLPVQMGRFKNKLHLVADQGLQVIQLQVSGTATSIAGRVKKAAGPTALIEDFKPQFNFVRNEDASKAPKGGFKRRQPWENPDVELADGEEFRNGNETHLTFSVSDQKAKGEHRSKYNNYLKEQRLKREKKEELGQRDVKMVKAKQTYDPNGVNLDMDSALYDLPSPRLELQKAVEPLWLERPMDGMAGAKGARGRAPQHDENKLIKKKFKPKPSTQAEIRDCSMVLDADDLHCISAGPKILNFGQVCVNSTNAKSFFITNDLPTQVLAGLQFQGIEELSNCTPESQVIPVGGTAGFDIIFTPQTEQQFSKTVNYTINGNHTFKFTLVAQVVPITVNLSRQLINFSFSEDNLDFTASETLTLTNPGNAVANYKWAVRGGPFGVVPEQGSMQPGESAEVNITYTPGFGAKNEEKLAMSVDCGRENTLQCVGAVEEPKCGFQDKKVEFGTVAVGIPKTKSVTLRSGGASAAVFAIEPPPAGSGITVSPMKGRIMAGERQTLQITLNATAPRDYSNIVIMAMIRGGRPAKLQVIGNAIVPDVTISQDEFNFGGITIGATACQVLSIENHGDIPAIMNVDLTDYPDFTIEMPEELMGQDDTESVITPIGSKNNADGDEDDYEEGEEEEEEEFRQWQLKANGNRTLSFHLLFTPTSVQEFSFPLPIQLLGCPDRPGLKRVVVGEGLKPRLLLSKTVVDFQNRVVARDRVKKIPYSMEVSFTNDDPESISWEVDVDVLHGLGLKEMFHVSPRAGELASGEKAIVRFTFLPDDAKAYSCVLPLYLDENRDRPYLLLTVKGTGIFPHLTFDRPEVLMPVVPLGVKSTCLFHVVNTGYDNLELRYRLPVDTQRVPISLNFPEGQSVGIAKERLPVEVTFTGRRPMSFMSKIDFYDEDDNKFSVPVYGTADNSMLSVYPFVCAHESEFSLFAKESKPILLLDNEQINNLETQMEAQNAKDRKRRRRGDDKSEENARRKSADLTPTGRALHDKLPPFGEDDIKVMLGWCNANVLRSTVNVLPDDVVASHGRPIIDMVVTTSGKQVPGVIKNQPQDSAERWRPLLEFYNGFLTFLKSYGALLHNIVPEQLLGKEDYTRAKEAKDSESGKAARISPAAAMQRRHHWEREWHSIAREAWAQVMMQVVRVFVLGRVTLKKFLDLPGMPPPTPRQSPRQEKGRRGQNTPEPQSQESNIDPQLVGSNVYSVPECILLKWMTYHVNQNLTAADPIRLINFDECLQDGTVICYLLASHVPSLEQGDGPLAGFHRECTSAEEAAENCARVTATMEHLGMGYRVSPEQLAEINSRNGVLLVLYLYQQLPQFIPKTTIEFSGSLGDPIRKSIELRNPSRKRITYTVALEGSSDFRILTNTITLEGERSGSFPIELYPRFSKAVEGRLTFRSRREGGVSAATMVFLLRSDIQSRQAVRTVRVENPLYDGKQIDMEITNPFDNDCVFQVSLKQEQLTFGGTTNQIAEEPMGMRGGPRGQPAQAGRPPRPPKADFASVEPHLQPFWCKTSSVRIRAGGSVVLPVHFLPFSEGQFRAQLIFLDEKSGEFLYEIIADAALPVPLEQVKFSTDLAVGRVDKDVTIPVKNIALQRAYQTAVDRLTGAAKNKAREALKKKEAESQPMSVFQVQLNSPYFNSQTQQLMIQPTVSGGDGGKIGLTTPRNGGVSANNIPLSFSPHAAGKFNCQLIMRPMDPTLQDVRVYEFEVNVTAPGIKTALEFSTPSRQAIFQEIPITNNSDQDWMLSAQIQGSRTFKGPQRLSVPAGKSANYTLSFQPEWVCEETGSLLLSNAQSGEKFEYELTGHGEEPLAEDHIVVACQARDKVEQTFTVHNTKMQPVMFSVESDLPHVSGESSIEVPANSSAAYSLTICPQLGGMYTGSITFMEPTGEFLWYTCEIQASSPEPEQTLEIASAVRRAVSVEISLANPLDEHVTFDVDLTGAGLLGDLNFSLGPQETATYELLFSPLVPGEQTGSVSFSNDKLGEFWYRLALTADPAPPNELESMSAPVGRSVAQTIVLENPTGEEVILVAKVDNRRNFTVTPSSVALGPYGSAEAVLEYTPSTLTEGFEEEAEIVFQHENLGEWVYLVKGKGDMPGEMDTVVVPTPIGQTASQSFAFRNPFAVPLQVQVHLKSEEPGVLDLFKLLLKRPQLNVPAFSVVQIPISFSPAIIAEKRATIDITTSSVPAFDGGSQSLCWTFPLRGIAEAPPFERAFNFKCQSRKHLEEVLQVTLRGLGDIAEGEEEEFTHELMVPEEESRGFVERSFFVRPRVNRLTDKTMPLEFDILFEPLRPFSTTVELVVNKKSGGRWRFEVQLEASEPEVDDVITIEAALHRTSSVSFKIQNQFDTYAPFSAEFSSNSSLAFTVFPSTGTLEPYGNEGQEFVISFTPTEYGKMQTGNLVIVTDDFQWTYEMRGTHQEYQVPEAKSKVSTKLEPGLVQRLGRGKAPKNILRANMTTGALKQEGRGRAAGAQTAANPK